MAFNDTLFQLGMDLTRSSPAQKEEHGEVAHVAHKQATIERASGRFAVTAPHTSGTQSMGTNVTIDVYGITGLDDLEHVETTLTRCVEAASSTLQHLHLHPVPATGGVSGLAVLSDGHISFHSRPTAGYAALDISTVGGCETHRWVAAAKAAFGKCQVVTRVHNRAAAVADGQDQATAAILTAIMPQHRSRSMASKQVRVKAA
jgi:S-adenosylmethionine decarboxylase